MVASKVSVRMCVVYGCIQSKCVGVVAKKSISKAKFVLGSVLFKLSTRVVLTIIGIMSGNLFLPKVARKDARFNGSFRETLGRS